MPVISLRMHVRLEIGETGPKIMPDFSSQFWFQL